METDTMTNPDLKTDSPDVAGCPAPVCSDPERSLNVTTDEAIDLLLSWANRIEELADFLEEPRWLGAAARKDYASGIQERSRCIIDLLCMLSGRGIQ